MRYVLYDEAYVFMLKIFLLCFHLCHVAITQIIIPYDKLAKRVNVKQLQQTMWCDMTGSTLPSQQHSSARMVETKTFSSVVAGLWLCRDPSSDWLVPH
jgi:hypothetical protein